MQQTTTCAQTTLEVCPNGCSNGACSPCAAGLYCIGDAVYRRGYVGSGSARQCTSVLVTANCPNGCTRGACLPTPTPETPTTPGACSAQYYCSGNNLRYTSSSCTDSLIQTCQFGCANAACTVPPAPTADITVDRRLIGRNETVQLTWIATNVTSCRVSENNTAINDAWSGAGAGCARTGCSAINTTSPLNTQTTYTLTCTSLTGREVSDSVTININPVFQER